ncbi:chromosomal replication initiator protein DnaA [Frateuria aurantia]|uniref:Chromosomal replication initiator protein DnaA n=1 Tax=Frateuria aurantia (strain ATCC 33424 / DSM 6220 / KCTC 2777 / LMG 1558 / NBRC 3245 / NCIMB 13370) TaxID=767434 RepID=H8KZ21_FRAAD|nr:chromosomal replication initiator protein DnaA [Frateuria aurantia]AFC84512.1 chromosomal replication initiator protein DnaA [Frateuria aurantia DSM 6220]
MSDLWRRCLLRLETELSAEELHTWLMPLQARDDPEGLRLFAPNPYTLDTVSERYLALITRVISQLTGHDLKVKLEVGSNTPMARPSSRPSLSARAGGHPDEVLRQEVIQPSHAVPERTEASFAHNLNLHYTFDTFVEGKSNQLGKAAAMQVAMNPGKAYNPLLLYGGTGLGKTHLMHAAGNLMLERNPDFKVLYLRSEQFVGSMIEALRTKSMDEFKRRFRSVDALLIDDIQFFAGKDTTQEEFFHTFNALFESKQQIVLTCDRYPKEVDKLEPRLKSRLGWGLSVAIEPPDFETRAAILLAKAQEKDVVMSDEVAMLLAKRIRSNVRDLEGALNTLAARANFYGRPITVEFAEETLRDLLATHAQAITIPNIQKITADYYQVRLQDLLSKRRVRSLARPRQIAMSLSKELTEHSLPEIGEAFGGRDHTTVLHACRTIRKFCETDNRMRQDWEQLIRILTG